MQFFDIMLCLWPRDNMAYFYFGIRPIHVLILTEVMKRISRAQNALVQHSFQHCVHCKRLQARDKLDVMRCLLSYSRPTERPACGYYGRPM